MRTARSDFHLRAENDYAFGLAKLREDHSDLLCIDDISHEMFSQHVLRSSFALVDHNRLDRMFTGTPGSDASPRVVSIIDHHADEGFHLDAQNRTIVVPVGSCASLVAKHFSSHWQPVSDGTPAISPDVATLLLTAILIDTNGLKKNGKAVQIDYDAVGLLLPRSNLKLTESVSNEADQVKIADIARTLNTLKSSISHLSSRDLLRRDYKEYSFTRNESPKTISVGIASVPLSLKTWLKLHPSPEFWNALDQWLGERHLDVLGVLFSFRSEKKNKHKRQTLWLVRQGLDELRCGLFKGLEARGELELEVKALKKAHVEGVERIKSGDVVTKAGGHAKVWKQLKVDATRKIVTPLVKSIIEQL